MKRSAISLLALPLLLFAACSKPAANAPATPAESVETASEEAPPAVDQQRLREAIALLGANPLTAEVAGLSLRARAEDRERLAYWSKVAEQMVASWPDRLGVERPDLRGAALVFAPGAEPGEGKTLADPYRTPGNAGGGVAVIRVGKRPDEAIEMLEIHELSHLMSERTFASPLPLWLEEGIAEWFARESTGADGATLQGTLRGTGETVEEEAGFRLDLTGPLADFTSLAREADAGKLPPFAEWSARPREAYSDGKNGNLQYALAAAYVRYLFESDETQGERMRELLRLAAEDPSIDFEAELAKRVGDQKGVDYHFREWLLAERDEILGDVQ